MARKPDKPRNLVAKYARRFNRAVVHRNRKRTIERERKHKGGDDGSL